MSYKLEAVNRALAAIGESPVNSLSSGVPDAEQAAQVVDEVTKDVLAEGWLPNMDHELKLVPDTSQQIAVPATYLRVDSAGKSKHVNVTVRVDPNDNRKKLYNVDKQTFEFDDPVYVDVVHLFEIDQIPWALQNYISARAARVFQERILGSVSLDGFTTRAEQDAWIKLLDAELEAGDFNMLTDNYYMSAITYRNNHLTWR